MADHQQCQNRRHLGRRIQARRMDAIFPVHVLISRVSAPSQAEFATEARVWIPDNERTRAEVTADGLIAHGIWEPDLETAIDVLSEHYRDLKIAHPETKFIYEPRLLEPYLTVTISIPEIAMGNTCADVVSKRRGMVLSIDDGDGDQMLTKFEAPVSELWGYSTDLRILTNGNGRIIDYAFSGYKPAPGPQGPAAMAVA